MSIATFIRRRKALSVVLSAVVVGVIGADAAPADKHKDTGNPAAESSGSFPDGNRRPTR
jgi:hypothetical protein